MRRLTHLIAAIVLSGQLRAQWTPQSAGTTAEFRGLAAVSSTVVWASGTRGRVARSIDGGSSWIVDSLPGADALDFRDIAAASATRVWTMSAGPAELDQAQIYHTDDGVRWMRQFASSQKGVFLDAMKFWDDRHGIAMSDPVDGHLFLLTTDDGGTTWARVPTADAPPVLPGEAAFAASGTCLAVSGSSHAWIGTGGGSRARVFRSADRGRTWSVADTPVRAGGSSSGIFSLAFTDVRRGIAVGGDYQRAKLPTQNVALTDDGGVTWRLAAGPLPQGYMSAVAYIPNTGGRSLVAVGLAGTALSTDGGERWLMVDSVAYNSVAFATRDDGWAVGPRGRIAKWTPSTAVGPKP